MIKKCKNRTKIGPGSKARIKIAKIEVNKISTGKVLKKKKKEKT